MPNKLASMRIFISIEDLGATRARRLAVDVRRRLSNSLASAAAVFREPFHIVLTSSVNDLTQSEFSEQRVT